jgi:hypothetical protein
MFSQFLPGNALSIKYNSTPMLSKLFIEKELSPVVSTPEIPARILSIYI